MEVILFIIAIFIFIIYIAAKKDENYGQNNTSSNYNNTYKPDQVIRNELNQKLNKNIKVSITIRNSLNDSIKDESIIDVTGQSTKINSNVVLVKYVLGMPQWPIQYEYDYKYADINNASIKQKDFYRIFKNSFLNGIYYELEENTNYAFILLNDLQDEYYNHKNLSTLESQFNILGKCYPKTKSYADSFLNKRRETENTLEFKNTNVYSYDNYYEDYWKLGSKYKDKLKLNEEEVILLNNIYNLGNVFFNVEYCSLEIIKLYISLIAELGKKYKVEGTNVEIEFSTVAKLLTNRHLNYSEGSELYNHYLGLAVKEIHSNVFKHCENAVREFYRHKRKLDTSFYIGTASSDAIFETKIISKVTKLLPILIAKVSPPDESTEIELYTQNTNRWKSKFEELTANYNENLNEFLDSIDSLVLLNEKNPSVENIFFEASKFISKYDKESALTFYICYLYSDLQSDTFNNKQLTKTIQKSLFKSNEQLHDFEKIVSELIKDKDVDKALESVSKIYKVKRKKIQLNRDSIKEVIEQHSETVELLNEYLKDDFEDEDNSIISQEIINEEVQIKVIQKSEEVDQSAFLSELTFTAIHTTTLELFEKSNFSISHDEFELFAKSKGVFKNQLIESINDTCYEFLDDLLIEEEEDYYTINTNYFQRISTK
ncbi:MAG: hypothetical protein H7239_04440 [Flavobacterium sp.]|nr:hypothetical protein [Flavobacterium sp.]